MGPAHTSRTRTPHLRPRDGAASLTLGLDTCGPTSPKALVSARDPGSLSKRRPRPPSFQLRRRRRRLGGSLQCPRGYHRRPRRTPERRRDPSAHAPTPPAPGAHPQLPRRVDPEARKGFPRGAGGRGRTSREKAGMHMRRGRERSGAARRRRVAELRSWQVPLPLEGMPRPKANSTELTGF